ncbi:MAG: hypothetical protein Q4C74_00295 [Rothia sp. (in: high G+C Gram-positive bacteria)]|nr:hypothetical protein [Rothia sp. (in: high G+C Gram-positive bacteria)]
MTIATHLLVFLHVLGATMVVGIWIANFKKNIVVPGQFHAACLQVLTGFALYFIQMSNLPENSATLFHMQVGIKMVLGLIIALLAFIGQRQYKAARASGDLDAAGNIALAHAVGGLGLINIAIATLWMGA